MDKILDLYQIPHRPDDDLYFSLDFCSQIYNLNIKLEKRKTYFSFMKCPSYYSNNREL